MSENLYCEGNKNVTPAYKDGWYRSFRGYPEVNADVWEMISEFSAQQLLLFFAVYVTDDAEYAGFLTREVLNGAWKRNN